MISNYIRLKWDSDLFGFNVARISNFNFDSRELASILQGLKSEKIRMVYWYVPANLKEHSRIALSHGGILADEKVTFIKKLLCANDVLLDSTYIVAPYAGNEPDDAMVKLALLSGEFSRFRLDPLFPKELFVKLYTCWIARSVRKEIAQQVFLAKDANDNIGLITLGTKDSRGDIGLVAVSEQARGKGVGKLMMKTADKYFVDNGFKVSQVVTQRVNSGACRLYESCGYHIEKIENIFHFWL